MVAGVKDHRMVLGIEHLLHTNIDDRAHEMEFLELGKFPKENLFYFLLPLGNL